MIGELKKRFIRVAMTAVTLLLVAVLGGLNLINLLSVRQQNSSLLRSLDTLEEPPEAGDMELPPGEPPEGPREGRPGNRRQLQELQTTVYFRAELDEDGSLCALNLDRFGALTEEEAQALVEEARVSGKSSGRSGYYRWLKQQRSDGTVLYSFLDTTRDSRSLWQVALLSLGVGALTWLLMLLIVTRLSARAVRPMAENMEKQKQFITDAGHEIKTPLAIIQANIEAMELTGGENKWTRNVKDQTQRLSVLTQNLLTLSKMEERREDRKPESFDLSRLTEETLLMFREMAESKELELGLDLEPGLNVTADRQELGRLLSLITDNAVKYCPAGGVLDVTSKREGKQALLMMENDCETWESLDTERIFDRFYRADESRDRQSGGYGIGLATARAIAQANGGSLWAEKRPGKVRFLLKL